MPKTPLKNRARARATVKNVAKAAGVSIGAVSSVMNNRHLERRISAATVQRIRDVAGRLGYLPNISARRLRSHEGVKDNVILAFITSYEAPLGIVNHLILGLREAVAARARFAGTSFSVLVEMFSAGQLSVMPGLLTGQQFNAAIITNTTPEDDLFLQRTHLPYPVVLVNRTIPHYTCVVEDAESGSRSAEVLVRAKRRTLAILHGLPLTHTTHARVCSFINTSSRLLGTPGEEIVATTLAEADAYSAMARFLRRGGQIDGLYAATDSMALGAYRAIKEAGLRIPQDVAVIGVGDYGLSPFFDPPLSTIGVERERLGREASRLLLDQLEGVGPAGQTRIEIPLETVLRASTGHHRRGSKDAG